MGLGACLAVQNVVDPLQASSWNALDVGLSDLLILCWALLNLRHSSSERDTGYFGGKPLPTRKHRVCSAPDSSAGLNIY